MAEIEYKHISKNFGAVKALVDVSFHVSSGEIRALLGGNGSGKSTLARITGGTVGQSSGEIWLDGEQIEINSPLESRKHGIAVTSQELSLFPRMTVVDNLSLLKVPKKLGIFADKAALRKRALEALEQVGLSHRADDRVGELPDDEKYLVEFAKAILFKPSILVVDEITSALRREEVEMVSEIIKKMAAEGCCILFISHRLNEIFDICTSISVLRNGELINTYKTEEATPRILLIDMIGRDPFQNHAEINFNNMETQETDIVLSVKNLHIPGFADSDLSFDLHKGEILGIAGLQGMGQSELLRMLYGMYMPTKFEYKGKEYTASAPEKVIQKGIGFLSGDRVTEGVFAYRSIGENCEVVNNLTLKRPAIDRDEVLKKNHVKYDKAYQPVSTLSGGNQQKVVISRWSVVEPDVLLCDDPTKGIDVAARFDVHDMLKNMAEKGSGIIFVSSDDEELATIAQSAPYFSVAVMYEGNIIKILRGADISVTNIIAASMPHDAEGA